MMFRLKQYVRIKGTDTVGRIVGIVGQVAVIDVKYSGERVIPLNQLEPARKK